MESKVWGFVIRLSSFPDAGTARASGFSGKNWRSGRRSWGLRQAQALYLCTLILILLPFSNFAQNFPTLNFDEDDSTHSLRLSILNIDVAVTGNRATTTFDMTFVNTFDRDLEGELVFPLQQGRSISRFAMDINGKLREGVVVDNNKGRKAYENIVRQAVDPGLLQQTDGNNFKANVYPIPANGSKRLVIAYEETLAYEDGDDLYNLPLHFETTVDSFDLDITAVQRSFSPQIQRHPLKNEKFFLKKGVYRMHYAAGDYLANKPLRVLLPVEPESGQVFVEKVDGKTYFYIRGFPQGATSRAKKPQNPSPCFGI